MKRFHYTEEMNNISKEGLAFEKQEEYGLPEFSKEVPSSSKKRENERSIQISYSWKKTKTSFLKVKTIEFDRTENLGNLFRIGARDGSDSIKTKYNGASYILRKTALEVAQALFKAASKMKGGLVSIVGYLRSLGGNDYVISKIEGEAWTFDKRIAKEPFHYIELESLGDSAKKKLTAMVVESLARIHSANFIMGRFSLNNILIKENGMEIIDLRKLRVSRKKAFVVDEFRNVMQYLFALGLLDREDIFPVVASYETINPESCKEWYEMQTGEESKDDFEVTTLMEEKLFE